MSLSDALGFEAFQLDRWFNQIKDNPEQLLLGAGDPLSAKLWSEITGKDFEPFVNEFGGPTDATFQEASDAGINTGTAGDLHGVAQGVASIYAGNYGANQLGGLFGGSNPASGASTTSINNASANGPFGSGIGGESTGFLGNLSNGLDIAGQASSLLGGGQQEQPRPAPAFNSAQFGGSRPQFSPNGLPDQSPATRFMSPGGSIEDLIGKPKEQGQELASQVRAEDKPSGFGAFFGNLDKNLQSPSKQIGLALLSQIDPRLAQAGLLAGGFFGENNVFGGQ